MNNKKIYGECPVCGDKQYESRSSKLHMNRIVSGVLIGIAVMLIGVGIVLGITQYPRFIEISAVIAGLAIFPGILGLYQLFFVSNDYCHNCEQYPTLRYQKIKWFAKPKIGVVS